MANFWEIAVHWVGYLFSLSFVYLLFLFSFRFGFKSGIWLLIAPVPVYCYFITFLLVNILNDGAHFINVKRFRCLRFFSINCHGYNLCKITV